MSMLPAFEAVLSPNLSKQDTDKLVTEIKSMKGVLSAAFHQCCGKCDHCPKESGIRVTYTGGDVQAAVARLPGVARIKPLL